MTNIQRLTNITTKTVPFTITYDFEFILKNGNIFLLLVAIMLKVITLIYLKKIMNLTVVKT